MLTATGYFRPGSSWLHRRHPTTKLLTAFWLLAAAFLLPPSALLALLAAVWLGAVSCGLLGGLLRSSRVGLYLLVSIVVVNAFFFPGGHDFLLALGPIRLTREGLEAGLVGGGRILVVLEALLLFLFTTLADDLLEALVQRGASARLAFVVLSAVQMVPRLQAKAAAILDAQQARGLAIGGSIGGRLRALVPLVGPLLLGTLIDVRERTFALEARGFGSGLPRTAYRLVADPPADRALRWLLAAAFVGLIVVALTIR